MVSTHVRPAKDPATTPPTLIAVEEFFGLPRRARALLSPDGRSVAYLAPWRGRLNLHLRAPDSDWSSPDGDCPEVRRITSDDRRNIDTFYWSSDGRYLLFHQDTDGDENWHLYRADPNRPDEPAVDLTPYDGVRLLDAQLVLDQPGTAFVSLNMRRPELADFYELDLATGRLTLVAHNPGDVVSWMRTPGRLLAFTMEDGGAHVLSEWVDGDRAPITRFSGADVLLAVTPTVPTPDGTGLWIGSSRGSDRTRLVRLDLRTGEQIGVDSHPIFDLDTPRPEADRRFPPSLILHPGTGELLGVPDTSAHVKRFTRWTRISPRYCRGWLSSPTETPPTYPAMPQPNDGWSISPTTAIPESPGSTTTAPARRAACSGPFPISTRPS
ncbi:hypothetical protein MMUR_33590 [Mycolicibacterium murale]|uniref:Peptidase S9 n=1 Tax=Mycolicibacterium murale TaxID=182220 RepID=A0A7I9WNH2_9MYCO|nr:hypothetical protein MMUR_33590 [Mycolicibacterium murale]